MKKAQLLRKIILIAITIAPIGLLLFIINKNLALSGTRVHTYDFSEKNDVIERLEPWQRLSPITEENGVFTQSIKDDIVYFDMQKSDPFETVTIKIEYENNSAQIVEVGALEGKNYFKKEPLESKFIDSLTWEKIEQNGITLYQKEKKYNTIEEFQINPPDEKIITYNLEAKKFINKEKYKKQNFIPLRIDTKENEANFVITKYSKPEKKDNTIVAQNTFEYQKLVANDGKFRFQITAPGLRESGDVIKVKKIETILEKEPLSIEKITTRIKKFFKL